MLCRCRRPLRWVARWNAHLQSARRKQKTQAPWPGDSAEAAAVLFRPAEVQQRREEKKGKEREDGEEDKSRDEEEEEEEEEEKSRGEMKGLQGEPARGRLVRC
ncbi:hypothetical protein TEQG_04843 [Trichophyton equinum CBS 127.97]|uniref:Uncharacterized protein n=1 Tax=Trichophyton equinum (strain ATCC MYA-4606 / CBS 127.97) TaxID=559882 RepID=F2PVB5_TRIEC|nr:hypothetical protein TEQG_04843 [Trichophyton equinum CBS 127.97]